MATTIDDPKVSQLLSEISAMTGESSEEAIRHALKERHDRLLTDTEKDYKARVMAAIDRFSRLPVLSMETPDEIIGYNESGYFD